MNSLNPLFIIPVETKVRELDAKILLSLFALEKGMDVVIGGLNEMKYLVDLLGRGVYLDKSIAMPKEKWFKKCVQKEFKIVALDEEGLVTFDAETYRQLRVSPGAMSSVDCFFAWGEEQMSIIKPAIGSFANRIAVTGNPRFDLLSSRFRPFFRKKVKSINDEYGRIILINTSFSFGNSTNSYQGLQQTFSQYPIAKERPEFFDGWLNEQQRIMRSFQEVLPEIRRRYPEHTIIIRPHPSEQIETWRNICRDYSDTYVIRDGGVVPWILSADVLVHWNCTTAIEAFLLNVPAIAYRKSCSGNYAQPLPNIVSFHALSEDELFQQIDSAVQGKLVETTETKLKKNQILRQYVASVDGELASEKIAEIVFRLGQKIERNRPLFQRGLQISKKIWRSILDAVVEDRKIRNDYSTSKFPETEIGEIKQIIDDLNSCLNLNFSVQVKKLWTNCFELRKLN